MLKNDRMEIIDEIIQVSYHRGIKHVTRRRHVAPMKGVKIYM